ncbi:phage/plasmid primase, P4 family [Pseudomonadales bacterium]|nr:phage/plasmid primase, P4 family [Pseudomonadales bacterium]
MNSDFSTIKFATAASPATHVVKKETTWQQLVDKFQIPRVGGKWGPVFVPAEMPSGPRQQRYVKAITVLTYDIDNKDGDNKVIPEPLSLAEMAEVIRCKGLNSIMYETHSSRPNHVRFRLLVQLAEPIATDVYQLQAVEFAKRLGFYDYIDKSCVELARCYYQPAVDPEFIGMQQYIVTSGEPLRIQALLAGDQGKDLFAELDPQLLSKLFSSLAKAVSTPCTKKVVQKKQSQSMDFPETDENVGKLKAALSYISSDAPRGGGKTFDDSGDVVDGYWLAIVWAIASLGWDSGEQVARDWSETSDRYTDEEFDAAWHAYDHVEEGGGVTVNSLFRLASEFGWINSPFEAVEGFTVDTTDNNLSTDLAESADLLQMVLNQTNVDLTDTRNGERFRDEHRGRVLFVRDTPLVLRYEPNKGWEVTDSDFPMRAAKQVIYKMTIACAKARRDGLDTKLMDVELKRSSTLRSLKAMLVLARSEPDMSIDAWKLDSDPYLLGVQNGAINLKTGRLLRPDPKSLVTKYCSVAFDPEAECPLFDKFLEEIVPDPDEREFLLRTMGYCLAGITSEQLWFFFHGIGANGKSVLLGLLEYLLGDYAAKIKTELLMHERGSSNTDPELLRLQGKRLVFANETRAGQRFDDAKIKAITGGDSISGRWLFSNASVTFTPVFKLLVVGNNYPAVTDDSHGFWRRVVLIPFSVSIPKAQQDGELPGKLRAEAPGLLNKLVAAFRRYDANGLHLPKSLSKATNVYQSEEDLVQQFLDEKCEVDVAAKISKEKLYDRYRRWCGDSGVYAVSTNRFSRKLTGKDFKLAGDKRHWLGLK